MRIGRRGRQGHVPGHGVPRNDSERIEAIAHDADLPVEEVLRDVAEFRLALETDMIVAAAAADEPALLSEIVDGERMELADFHDRLLERLVDAAAQDELAARRERRRDRREGPTRTQRAGRLVAAAAALVALVGVTRATPAERQSDNRLALATASQQYADLTSAVSGASHDSVSEAAAEFHETLESLITQHAADPQVAQQAAALLHAEIQLLEGDGSVGASHVLAEARSLITLLRQATPPNVRASVAPILDAVPSPRPSPTASPKPKPKPSSASPAPSPKPSSSPKASSSPSGEDDNPLHTP